jgi:transposase-like protein
VDSAPPSYRGHRYPVEIISHCVWLYHRFPLSFREVEELMLQRGVVVSYETVRRWCARFGQTYANGLRRRRPRPGDKWHLDEVFIKVNGEQRYLWRAVDADGNVLDVLVQNRRDTAAARRFFRRLMKKTHMVPRVVVTDKPRSYGAAHREVMPRSGTVTLTDRWEDLLVDQPGKGRPWGARRCRTRGTGTRSRSSPTVCGCTSVSRCRSARSRS